MQPKNLKLAVPLSFISMLFFPGATWMFFFLNYLNFAQIAGIMGIGALFSLVMEIPTGVFADIVGRKWAVSLSYFLFMIAMIGTAYSTTYLAFLFWTLINGLVNCLYSGSMEALIYDSLKQDDKEGEFDHWTSRMEMVTWIGLAISVVIGGYLYAVDPRAPYVVQAIVTAIATILGLLLIEPAADTMKYRLSDIFYKNLEGFRELFGNIKISYLTIMFTIIGLGYYVASDILGISQVKQYGLDTKLVGWVFGVGYIISAMASHYYPKLKDVLGEMRLVWISAGMLILSFLLARYVGVWAGVGLIILRIASSTTFRNSRSVIMNREIKSKSRATTLSTLNLLTQLPYAILATFIGAYIDKTSPNQFAFVLGVGISGVLMAVQAARALSMRVRR